MDFKELVLVGGNDQSKPKFTENPSSKTVKIPISCVQTGEFNISCVFVFFQNQLTDVLRLCLNRALELFSFVVVLFVEQWNSLFSTDFHLRFRSFFQSIHGHTHKKKKDRREPNIDLNIWKPMEFLSERNKLNPQKNAS